MVCIIEDNFQIQAPGGLYSEELIIGGIFAFQIWGASIRRGLYTRRGLFSEFTVFSSVVIVFIFVTCVINVSIRSFLRNSCPWLPLPG